MTISLRLSESEASVIKAYTAMNGITMSDFARRAMLERIEDEYDLKACEEAIAAYRENPVTFSHEEVAKMLEFD